MVVVTMSLFRRKASRSSLAKKAREAGEVRPEIKVHMPRESAGFAAGKRENSTQHSRFIEEQPPNFTG